MTTMQHIDIAGYAFLRCDRNSSSLSRCGAIRGAARTPRWRDREEQRQKSFTWSPIRRLQPRLRSSRPSLILALLIWSDCSLGKPRGISSEPKRTAGSVTLSRTKEAS